MTNDNCNDLSYLNPVIYAYTREKAIYDGVLVDISNSAGTVGFKVPVAVTRAVWDEYIFVGDCGIKDDPRFMAQELEDLHLWIVLKRAIFAIQSLKDYFSSELTFEINATSNDEKPSHESTTKLKIVSGAGDAGEPVVTIMLPSED